MTARADASLIDGPVRTIVLVIGGLACAAFALAWLLCRAAAIADRVEPGCEADAEPGWVLSPEQWDAARRPWDLDKLEAGLSFSLDCQGRHGYARQPGGAWRCLICDEPQLYTSTEVYDHLAVEALHADLAAFERGER